MGKRQALNIGIDFSKPQTDFFKCSVCGKILEMNLSDKKSGYIYCPNCDAMPLFTIYLRNK